MTRYAFVFCLFFVSIFSANLVSAQQSPYDAFRLEENNHRFEELRAEKSKASLTAISAVASKPYDVVHYGLDFTFPNVDKYLEAIAKISIELIDATDSISFDFVDMSVDNVSLNGKPLSYLMKNGLLTIKLPAVYQPKSLITLEVDYHGTPARGFYSTSVSGDKNPTLFSIVEPEYARYIFPCYDAPLDKALSSMTITVPAPMVAVSNGLLKRVSEDPASNSLTYVWEENYPIATYLMSLTISEYVKMESKWDGMPIEFYVRAGDEANARKTLGRTDQMLQFFSSRVAPYPFKAEKYAIAVVPGQGGAMEHTTVTTFGRGLLELSYGESYAAHELSHHWWGDDLTMRDWNHLWLNEGFASYFDVLWYEFVDGKDKLAQRMEGYKRSALIEDDLMNTPIVNPDNTDFDSLFNSLIYEKGAWVLHMLRNEVGDNLFWAGLKKYEEKFRYSGVITEDLEQVMEEVSQEDLTQFFKQWIYKAGYPKLEIDYKFISSTSSLKIRIKEKQNGDAFVLNIPVRITFSNGTQISSLLHVDKADNEFLISNVTSNPRNVRFDPENTILKEMVVYQPEGNWIDQARNSEDWYGKLEAIRALSVPGSDEGYDLLLGFINSKEEHYLILDAALEALGRRRDVRAVDVLVPFLKNEIRWVKIGAVAGLGECGFDSAIQPLIGVLKNDKSDWVRAAAAYALNSYKNNHDARKALETALKEDKSERVREVARRVLADSL